MESNQFNTGDVVVLKSGSVKFTVVCSDENTTDIIYFNTIDNTIIDKKNLKNDILELA